MDKLGIWLRLDHLPKLLLFPPVYIKTKGNNYKTLRQGKDYCLLIGNSHIDPINQTLDNRS